MRASAEACAYAYKRLPLASVRSASSPARYLLLHVQIVYVSMVCSASIDAILYGTFHVKGVVHVSLVQVWDIQSVYKYFVTTVIVLVHTCTCNMCSGSNILPVFFLRLSLDEMLQRLSEDTSKKSGREPSTSQPEDSHSKPDRLVDVVSESSWRENVFKDVNFQVPHSRVEPLESIDVHDVVDSQQTGRYDRDNSRSRVSSRGRETPLRRETRDDFPQRGGGGGGQGEWWGRGDRGREREGGRGGDRQRERGGWGRDEVWKERQGYRPRDSRGAGVVRLDSSNMTAEEWRTPLPRNQRKEA